MIALILAFHYIIYSSVTSLLDHIIRSYLLYLSSNKSDMIALILIQSYAYIFYSDNYML